MTKIKINCAVCKEEAKKRCSRCTRVFYCSIEHQKSDWNKHKKGCFPPGAECTRCLETIPFPAGPCRVPHPNHLRQDRGTVMSTDFGWQRNFCCGACSKPYTIGDTMTMTSTTLQQAMSVCMKETEMPVVKGPKWCYEGPHTVKPLKDNDLRKIHDEVVVVHGTCSEIQDEIDALDGNHKVKLLKVLGGLDDGKKKVNLAISLPNLEELQLEQSNMDRIILNQELTPNLRKIHMQNAFCESGEPDITILCPLLKDISIHYCDPQNCQWIIDMLEVATALERFDSYKLRADYLKFASNHLKSISLHRAELLRRVDLWAPRLTNLNVEAAYDLAEIHFLEKHDVLGDHELVPLGSPEDFTFREELRVDASNACLGTQAVEAILAHPRFRGKRSSL